MFKVYKTLKKLLIIHSQMVIGTKLQIYWNFQFEEIEHKATAKVIRQVKSKVTKIKLFDCMQSNTFCIPSINQVHNQNFSIGGCTCYLNPKTKFV